MNENQADQQSAPRYGFQSVGEVPWPDQAPPRAQKPAPGAPTRTPQQGKGNDVERARAIAEGAARQALSE